jgi:2-dehydro-3-deoxy-D-gluconate 5-dehydrogenase
MTPNPMTPTSIEMFRLDGLVALVTGASAGLGAAIAVGLAEAGADVAAHGNTRSPSRTCQRIEACGRRAAAVTGDLGDRAVSGGLVNDVMSALGRLDILVNNAGIIRRAPAEHYSDEDWDHVIEVDLTSAFRLARAAGRHMLEAGRGGRIVNVTSLLAFQGGITVPAYAAAKGGLAQLTKALANEWASKGINVNAIAPGYMETDVTTALRADPVRNRQIMDRIPAGRWGQPDDVAGAVVFLASRAASYVHGHVLAVDGGWLGR